MHVVLPGSVERFLQIEIEGRRCLHAPVEPTREKTI